MKVKLSKDTTGQVTWSGLLVIIVIGIIVWQVLAPYTSLTSPSDFFGFTESTDPDTLSFSAYMYNSVTDTALMSNEFFENTTEEHANFPEHWDLLSYDLTLSEVPQIQVIMSTNAPKSILSPYTVTVTTFVIYWDDSTKTHYPYSQTIGFGYPDGTKEFKWDMSPSYVQLAGWLPEYTVIYCKLISPSGSTLFNESWVIY